MLNDLVQQESSAAVHRTDRRNTSPGVRIVDELGYVAYGNRHADVLFEVVNRRYEAGRPIVVTTNRSFTDWGGLFPNATCVVPLVDRLVHHCEIVHIGGESYRLKEAEERSAMRRELAADNRRRARAGGRRGAVLQAARPEPSSRIDLTAYGIALYT